MLSSTSALLNKELLNFENVSALSAMVCDNEMT